MKKGTVKEIDVNKGYGFFYKRDNIMQIILCII